MNLHEVYDHINTRPYAEDDYLLNTFVEETLRRVSWKLFQHQEDFVYMANEREDGIPVLKENAIWTIEDYINSEFAWLRSYILTRLLMSYRLDNVELGEEGTWWLRDELGEEEFLEWESRARKFIYNDYVKTLGEERADEYFRKIGRLHYKDGDVTDLRQMKLFDDDDDFNE